MKNFERIQQMTIEELSDVIMCPAMARLASINCKEQEPCAECKKRWLMEEEKECPTSNVAEQTEVSDG